MANAEKRNIVTDNLKKIEELSSQGLSVGEIAQSLGISRSTLYKYKKQSTELTDAIKKGREAAVEKIENAMYNSAIGCTRLVKKIRWVKQITYDPETGKKSFETEEPIEYTEEIYYPPDNTAGIFLLKNWGKYSNEPQTNKLREKEIELREKQINAQIW